MMEPTKEEIEIVAAAMWNSINHASFPWEQADPVAKDGWRIIARAGIIADRGRLAGIIRELRGFIDEYGLVDDYEEWIRQREGKRDAMAR